MVIFKTHFTLGLVESKNRNTCENVQDILTFIIISMLGRIIENQSKDVLDVINTCLNVQDSHTCSTGQHWVPLLSPHSQSHQDNPQAYDLKSLLLMCSAYTLQPAIYLGSPGCLQLKQTIFFDLASDFSAILLSLFNVNSSSSLSKTKNHLV